MSLEEFLTLLAVPPASLSFHLTRLVVLQASLGLIWSRYQDGRAKRDKLIIWGFGTALALQFGPIFLAAVGPNPTDQISGLLEALMAATVIWSLTYPWIQTLSLSHFLPAGVCMGILGLALVCPGRPVPVWAAVYGLLFGVGASYTLWRRKTSHWFTLSLIFLLLGSAALPPLLLPQSLAAVGASRLLTLAGYLALVPVLYRQTTVGWRQEHSLRLGLESELREVSRGALGQSEKWFFMLQLSQVVDASLDLRTVLKTAAEALALGGHADHAVIALRDESDANYMWAVVGYTPAEHDVWESSRVRFALSNFPTIRTAAEQKESVILQRQVPSGEVIALHALLGSAAIGPLLIQPLIHQDVLEGVVLLSNVVGHRSFTDQDQEYCSALSNQVTTAIVNARLHQCMSRLLQEQAADANQRQAMLESIVDGVIATDQQGNIILANKAAGRVLSYGVEPLPGRKLADVCPSLWQDGQPGGRSFELFDRIITGNMAQVNGGNTNLMGLVAVFRDVTRETQAERAKSQFIETVSHELRTPMTAIKGYTAFLTSGMGGELSDRNKNFVNTIQTNTERMENIVNNMITVSEMEGEIAFSPRPIDITPILQAAIQAIRPNLEERKLQFEAHLPADIPPVTGDGPRLRQVMDNVLSNACKFTPEGGQVSIHVRTFPAGIFTPDSNGYLVVAVKDSGVGIPPEECIKIFERFYRAENILSIEAGGTGVGLTIAKDLIERHGGRIWVSSQVGQGSTFTFIIPLAPEENQS